MKLSLKFIALYIGFLSSCFCTAGQQIKKVKPDYRQTPVWISMIDDTLVNYYEAVKAFDMYWKDHPMPVDREGQMGTEENHEAEKDNGNSKNELSSSERSYRDEMTYQVKRFLDWKHEMLPYVQGDGRILTPAERRRIWDRQQEEIKKQSDLKKQ